MTTGKTAKGNSSYVERAIEMASARARAVEENKSNFVIEHHRRRATIDNSIRCGEREKARERESRVGGVPLHPVRRIPVIFHESPMKSVGRGSAFAGFRGGCTLFTAPAEAAREEREIELAYIQLASVRVGAFLTSAREERFSSYNPVPLLHSEARDLFAFDFPRAGYLRFIALRVPFHLYSFFLV